MSESLQQRRDAWNASRFRPGESGGLYESYFLRGNHPERPLAFWIRYTIFCPKGRPQEAQGELWAIYFDGETGKVSAAKESRPITECQFSRDCLDVRIGSATLTDGALDGRAASAEHAVSWRLTFAGGGAPLLLLPEAMYSGGFPKAKALVAQPNAVFSGTLTVDGREIALSGWRGSQNHNWGSRHTDRYAWGQVAGFDNAPEAFLECAAAQVRVGPFWSPRLTLLVLRDGDEEIALNGLLQAARAQGDYDFFTWTLDSRSPQARLHGRIEAPAAAFVGLNYLNPPGGSKTCLNSKLASAEFTLERPGRPAKTFVTRSRAAFEILTDRRDHGIAVAA
ncbi:MAG: hypothetical protein AMXMBFR31_15980 [Candidatus Desulfobacillus denitrificans]|nr:MAG: hypothetical protein BroJett012_16930 [Betaproteobacteria bacterium]